MSIHEKMLTEDEFYKASGLHVSARDRFEELGFIKPRYQSFRFYSPQDAKVAKKMMELLDGKTDLKTAHRKAVRSLHESAA